MPKTVEHDIDFGSLLDLNIEFLIAPSVYLHTNNTRN